MAKKVKSVSLSDDVIEIVEKYKSEKKLGSFSLAIERIILSHDSMNEEHIREIVESMIGNANIQPNTVAKKTSKNDAFDKMINDSINDVFENMPD